MLGQTAWCAYHQSFQSDHFSPQFSSTYFPNSSSFLNLKASSHHFVQLQIKLEISSHSKDIFAANFFAMYGSIGF